MLYDQCSNHSLARFANPGVAAPPQQRFFQILIRTRRGPLNQSEEKPSRLRNNQILVDQTLQLRIARSEMHEVFAEVFLRRHRNWPRSRWHLDVRGLATPEWTSAPRQRIYVLSRPQRNRHHKRRAQSVDRRVPVSVVRLSCVTPALERYSVIDKQSVVLPSLVADAVTGIKQTCFRDRESKTWSCIAETILSTQPVSNKTNLAQY